MKDILKNKKVLIGLAVVILVLGGLLAFFLTRDSKQENNNEPNSKEKHEGVFTMYVSINPLVKLEFKSTYYECLNDEGKKVICEEVTEVVDYELLNDDAKDFYKDIDFKNKNVFESLVLLCDVARDNKVAFKSFDITSNYKFDRETIIKNIKDGSKYSEDFDVFIDIEEYLNEQEIIDKSEEEVKIYTVSFDTNGGEKLDDRLVKDGTSLTDIKKPTRSGYTFVEWQLNGKKYDENDVIKSDIKLKAVWKKNEDKTVVKPVDDKVISKEVPVSERKVRATYSDKKRDITGFLSRYDYNNVVVKVEGPKSLVDKIDASNINISFDVSKFTISDYYKVKIEVYEKLDGVTYTVLHPESEAYVTVKKKVESTIDKINLNENILVYEWSSSGPLCGSMNIASNFNEVFKDYINSSEPNVLSLNSDGTDIKEGNGNIFSSTYNNLSNKLVVDEAKASAFIKKLDSFKNMKIRNVANFEYNYNGGVSFDYSFDYLLIADEDISRLPNEFTSDNIITKELEKNVNYVYGSCGDSPYESVLLNEALCTKYNLNCSRW